MHLLFHTPHSAFNDPLRISGIDYQSKIEKKDSFSTPAEKLLYGIADDFALYHPFFYLFLVFTSFLLFSHFDLVILTPATNLLSAVALVKGVLLKYHRDVLCYPAIIYLCMHPRSFLQEWNILLAISICTLNHSVGFTEFSCPSILNYDNSYC